MLLCALLVLGVLVGGGTPASAEVFRLVAPDGTVHFTNAPTDPRYRRFRSEGAATGPSLTSLRASVGLPYSGEITEASGRYGIPETLIRAVIRVESGFNPRAISRRGARGLMQLMPETAALLGVRDSFNPRQNIDAGVRHLRKLMERFGHDLTLVLAAYNAGEQAVVAYRGLPPYQETRVYVSRVLQIYGEPALPLPQTTFRKVELDGTMVYTNIPSPPGRLF
jgi:soluble lytic murein transglycosylase-like protein